MYSDTLLEILLGTLSRPFAHSSAQEVQSGKSREGGEGRSSIGVSGMLAPPSRAPEGEPLVEPARADLIAATTRFTVR